MGKQKTTQQTTIPAAGGQESQLLTLLSKFASAAGGQLDLGALGQIAGGNIGGPTAADQRLVQQSIGATSDMAQRDLMRTLGPILAKLNEDTTARNIGGSSIASLNKKLAGDTIAQQLQDILSGAQSQGAQALLNLPGQRSQLQIGANQALFQALTGAANPVLTSMLNARMAQPTSVQTAPMDWAKMAQFAGAVGAAPFTGGASLAGIGIPGLGGKK